MTLINFIRNRFTAAWQKDNRHWWVKIVTMKPHCTYYFGPFHTLEAAKSAYPAYVDDLRNESSHIINVVIRRCEPKHLTLFDTHRPISAVILRS